MLWSSWDWAVVLWHRAVALHGWPWSSWGMSVTFQGINDIKLFSNNKMCFALNLVSFSHWCAVGFPRIYVIQVIP